MFQFPIGVKTSPLVASIETHQSISAAG